MEVAHEAEPRDVGSGVHGVAHIAHRGHPTGVQRGHGANGRLHFLLGDRPPLERGTQDTRADRLCQHEAVSGPSADIRDHPVRVDLADRDHPELGLPVVDRVPAEHERTGLLHLVHTAAHCLAQQLQHRLVAGPRHQVEHEQGRRAHRVEIAQGVGGGDGAEAVRVVHDGREEVHRRHDRAALRCLEDRRIVAAQRGHQDA